MLLLFGVFLFFGCSNDDDPTGPNDPAGLIVLPECSAIDSITVTINPELSFAWAPDCRIMGWNIEPSDSGADQWLVLSEGSNSIESPIIYGVVPDGAREIHAAEDLIPGVEYNLYLYKWIGPGDQDGEVIKSTSFAMWLEQESYGGDCLGRPEGTVCVKYPDDYIWLVQGPIYGWEERVEGDQTIHVAISTAVLYEHILGTNLVRTVRRDM